MAHIIFLLDSNALECYYFQSCQNSRITQRTINHRHSFLDLAKFDQVNKVPTGLLIIISRVLIVKESSKLDAEKRTGRPMPK